MPKSAGSFLLSLSPFLLLSSFSLTIFYSVFRLFRLRLTSQFYSALRPLPSTSIVAFSDRSLLLSYRCTLFTRAWHLANRLRRSDCTVVRWKRLQCTCSETRPGIGASPTCALLTQYWHVTFRFDPHSSHRYLWTLLSGRNSGLGIFLHFLHLLQYIIGRERRAGGGGKEEGGRSSLSS